LFLKRAAPEVSKKGKKKKLPHQIVRDMKVVINQAKLRIKLKPRDSESWAPEFTIDVKNVVIQTSNDQFKVRTYQKNNFLLLLFYQTTFGWTENSYSKLPNCNI
jgi:hypothetical protein